MKESFCLGKSLKLEDDGSSLEDKTGKHGIK